MQHRSFRLVLGVITSASLVLACGDGALTESEREPVAPGPAGSTPDVGSTDGENGDMNEPGPAIDRVDEGAPPVTGPLGGSAPNAGAPSAGMPNAGMPNAGMPNTGMPNLGVPNAGPVDVERTDCIIPSAAPGPIGYGSATTGGGAATPVVVSSFAEAEAALADYRSAFGDETQSALVLRYTGTFDYASITDVCAQHVKEPQILEVKEMENVTFEGAPGSSANFGIKINRAKNVIIRNMTLGLLPGGDGSDAITVEGNGENGDVENVWIDHNELFSSTKDDCDGAGDTEFDGLIDIKRGARRITVSYNFLHDHQKTGLIGFSDSDDMERYVTFHHNRYENVVSRTPLHRFGYIHIFNNYYGDITSSGINVRMGGVALIESNFFENTANPVTSRYSDVVGFWDLRDNHVGPGVTWSTESDTLANGDNWQSTQTYPAAELDYAYTPDDAACVKQIVKANAGATL